MAAILVGFPGVGKTYTVENRDEFTTLDIDVDKFYWTYDEEGEHVVNPMFPVNLLKYIAKKSFDYDFILLPIQPEVRQALQASGLDYAVVYPTLELKYIYIQRYRDLNYDADFISDMEQNYSSYINELVADPGYDIQLNNPTAFIDTACYIVKQIMDAAADRTDAIDD